MIFAFYWNAKTTKFHFFCRFIHKTKKKKIHPVTPSRLLPPLCNTESVRVPRIGA